MTDPELQQVMISHFVDLLRIKREVMKRGEPIQELEDQIVVARETLAAFGGINTAALEKQILG